MPVKLLDFFYVSLSLYLARNIHLKVQLCILCSTRNILTTFTFTIPVRISVRPSVSNMEMKCKPHVVSAREIRWMDADRRETNIYLKKYSFTHCSIHPRMVYISRSLWIISCLTRRAIYILGNQRFCSPLAHQFVASQSSAQHMSFCVEDCGAGGGGGLRIPITLQSDDCVVCAKTPNKEAKKWKCNLAHEAHIAHREI